MLGAMVPSFALGGPGPSLEGLPHSAGFGVRNGGWKGPRPVPRREDLMGSCSCPHFPTELSLGGEQTCRRLPRVQSQGKAKEAGFNSEPCYQPTFPGGFYVPHDLPVLTCLHPPLPSNPSRARDRGKCRARGLEEPDLWGRGRATWTEAVGPAAFTTTPSGDACADSRNGCSVMGCR